MIKGIFVKSTKEILFSRHRHDCRFSLDGNFSVDGGLDYFKVTGDVNGYEIIFIDEKVLLQYNYFYSNNNDKVKYPQGYHGRYVLSDKSNINFFSRLITNFADICEYI